MKPSPQSLSAAKKNAISPFTSKTPLLKSGSYDGAYLDIRKVILLQAEGGKRMRAADYFRGHPIEI